MALNYLAGAVSIQIEPGHGVLHRGQNPTLDVDTPRGIAFGRTDGADDAVLETQPQFELFQKRPEVLFAGHCGLHRLVQRVRILQRRIIQLKKMHPKLIMNNQLGSHSQSLASYHRLIKNCGLRNAEEKKITRRVQSHSECRSILTLVIR